MIQNLKTAEMFTHYPHRCRPTLHWQAMQPNLLWENSVPESWWTQLASKKWFLFCEEKHQPKEHFWEWGPCAILSPSSKHPCSPWPKLPGEQSQMEQISKDLQLLDQSWTRSWLSDHLQQGRPGQQSIPSLGKRKKYNPLVSPTKCSVDGWDNKNNQTIMREHVSCFLVFLELPTSKQKSETIIMENFVGLT